MAILNRIASNWSFQEREKLNNNWIVIEGYLSNLQGQINILTGDIDVQELVDQINDILNQGTIVVDDLKVALQDASTVIGNAQSATTDANNAAQQALDAVNNIQSMIDNFSVKGIYDNDTIYSKNNSVYHEGCSYIYTNNTPSKGNPPPNYPTVSNAHWQMTAAKGVDGTGAISTVAGVSPNSDGNVPLLPINIGAVNESDYIDHLNQFATTEKLGHIKPDGETIKVDPSTGIASVDYQLEPALPVTLKAGWSHGSNTLEAPFTFYKDPFGIVHIEGTAINDGTGSSTCATLPEGYRPKRRINIPFTVYDGTSIVVRNIGIYPNGDTLAGANVKSFTISGSFRTD